MRAVLPVVVLLAGCASPSPEFFGTPAQRLVIDGSTITVHRRGSRAQAIRSGSAWGADHALLRERMLRAIEQATGCTARPDGVWGDSGVLNARLDC